MAEEVNSAVTQTEGQEEAPKTYTQAEVDALLQSESDRRVTAALKKAAEKSRAEQKEAEKLAQMNAQQKYEYELEQRERAIAEKERQLTLADNRNAASKILADKGISLELVDFVVAEDAETMNANIGLLEKAFKASVRAEVEKRMGSKAPKQGLPPETEITRERFAAMSLMEQQELYISNPDLYNTLTKGI